MNDTEPEAPLTPDPPSPPGQDIEVPDLPVEAPEDQDIPDGTAVSEDAGMLEAPD
jgi:hypothetical protein